MKIKIFIFIITILFSCTRKENDLPVLFIDFDEVENIELAKYKKSEIHLELSDSSMLGRIDEIYLSENDLIFIRSRGKLYLFDKVGRFLNQIGKKGSGPSEYTHFSSFLIKDDIVKIYDAMQKKILCYNFKGDFIKHINLKDVFTDVLPNLIYSLPNGNFISRNTYGGKSREIPSYSFLNKKFEIVSSTENRKLRNGITVLNNIYSDDNRILSWEILSDTIFSIENSERCLCLPKYYVDFNKKSIPKSIKKKDLYDAIAYTNEPNIKNKVATLIRNVRENDSFLSFTFLLNEKTHYVKYNKNNKQIKTYSLNCKEGNIEPTVLYKKNQILIPIQVLDAEKSNPIIYILDDSIL